MVNNRNPPVEVRADSPGRYTDDGTRPRPASAMFLESQRRLARMIFRAAWPSGNGTARRSLRRMATMAVFGPLLWLLNLYHWLGLMLDEVLFRGYRNVRVDQPVFVLGVPRSGTTFMHEVLADDGQYTTFATWECFFALSVTWRRFWRGLGRVDRWVGRPFGRLVDRLARRMTASFEETHPVRLDAPEEDFMTLLPAMTCFLLIVPFPDARDLWRMARLDADPDARFRRRQLEFYRRCIQRHLYDHGPERRFLSKNASFAGLIGGLDQTFPDAGFVCCMRAPERALSSQFSVLSGPMRAFSSDGDPERFRERIIECFQFYYTNLLTHAGRLPANRIVMLNTADLHDHLATTVERVYEKLGLTMTTAFRDCLERRARDSRRHRSRHSHKLEDADLTADDINDRFAAVHAAFDFSRSRFSKRTTRES